MSDPEKKIGRVFVDAYGRPWILRAISREAVFIESADEVKSTALAVFEKLYQEMPGGGA